MGNHVLKAFFYLNLKPLRQIKQGGKVMKKRLLSAIVSLCLLRQWRRLWRLRQLRSLSVSISCSVSERASRLPRRRANTPAANRDPCQTISSGWSLASVPGKSPPQKPCGRPGLNLTPGDMNLDPYIFRRAERCVLY